DGHLRERAAGRLDVAAAVDQVPFPGRVRPAYCRHSSTSVNRAPDAEGVASILQVRRREPMKWITRKNAKVDRVACPWLIRRFVDERPEFLFVDAAEVMAVAEREGAIPYDVPDVELGHVDGRCSFESIMLKYGLKDPALRLLARIVHGADVDADRELMPEAAGLNAIAHGSSLVHGDDDLRKLELETPMYDALYAWCQARAPAGWASSDRARGQDP